MRIVVVLALALAVGACTKDRPEEFSQNVGENLQSVSEYNGYEFTVETGEAYSSSSTTSSAEVRGGVDRDISLLNSFPLVSYTTKGDKLNIFRDIPFRGRPGFTYKFRYKVHHDMVMVYQISKKEDIPGPLFTSAKKIAEDLYEVPYAYKPISLVKVEHVEDRNKEQTTTLGEFSAYDVSDASHFRLANVPVTLYEPQSKVDVLPANLFSGEWFYAVTLTKASIDKSGDVGAQLGQDFNFQPASRIRFEPRRDRIRAVNTNVDAQVDDTDDLNLKSVIDFPVRRLNYRMKKIGAGAGQQEEKLYAEHPEAPAWQDLQYIEVDFTEVRAGRLGAIENNSELHNFTISKDFFSFDLEFKAENIRLKFAFKKAHDPKQGLGYPKADRKIYGYFTGQKNFINNYKVERESDYEKNIFLARYYPDNGVIEYHLSDLTPRSFYDVARRAVDMWDEAFQRAGTGIRIKLNETKRVAVGDIRYNVINIIKNVDTDGGGYGPQLADFNSGEIISATANVHTGYYTNVLIETARNYIRSKMGVFNEKYVAYAHEWGTFQRFNTSNGVIAFTMMDDIFDDKIGASLEKAGVDISGLPNANRLIRQSKLAELIGKHQVSNYIETGDGGKIIIPPTMGDLSHGKRGEILDEYLKARRNGEIPPGLTFTYEGNTRLFNQRFGHDKYIASSRRLLRIVKMFCEDDINRYVEDLKAENASFDSEKELKLVESCKEKTINEAVLGTVMHEMGHNFGLRHNFYGATDTENFPLGTDNVNDFGLSSVMDYMGAAKVNKLGNYDIAAIRYGYGRKAESKNGIIDLKDGKSIVESAKAQGQEFIKKYKYCTDEDIDVVLQGQRAKLPVDPMCARHQFGATPLEVVRMGAIDYEAFNAVYGKRFDRANGPLTSQAQGYFVSTMGMPIITMYNQWRWHLKNFMEAFNPVSRNEVDRIKKKSSGYLENITAEEFDIILEAMKNDKGRDGRPSKHAKNFAEYYEAGQAAYAFLRNLISIPSKYCAVKADENAVNYDLVSFYNVRQKMYHDDGIVVASCEQAEDHGYFAQKGLNLVGSLGEYYGQVTSEMDILDPNSNRVDILGYQYASASALALLTLRVPTSREMAIDGFKPNFLDNPYYRVDLQDLILTRMSLGVHSAELGTKYIVEADEVVDEDIMEFAKSRDPRVGGTIQARAVQRDRLKVQIEQMKAYAANLDAKIEAAKAAAAAADANADAGADDASAAEDDAAAADNKIKVSLVIDGETVTAEVVKPSEADAEEVIEEVAEEAGEPAPTIEQMEKEKVEVAAAIKETEAQLEEIIAAMEEFNGQIVGAFKDPYLQALQQEGTFYPFFAEKQNVLLGQFGQLIKGLQHPEKPELTLDRMQMFTTVKDPQEIRSIKAESDPSEYAFVQYGARQYLAMKNQNLVMYNMIKEAQRLESVRDDAINGVDGSLYEGEILPQALTMMLPSFDELAAMPLAQLGQFFGGKAQALQMVLIQSGISPEQGQKVMGVVIDVIAPYINFAQNLPSLQAEFQAKGVNTVLAGLVEIGNSEENIKGLTKGAVPEIIDGLKQEVAARKVKATEYNKNFEEYEAQRNILSTVILAL